VLRISGEAHDLGAATGRLLGGAVTRTSEPLRQAIIDACEATGLVASLTDGMRLDWRTRFLDDGMPDRDRRWVAGLVRGANASGARIDYPTLLRAQAAIDVGAASKLTDEGELRTVARSLSFVVPQPGPSPERLWVGHTLSLPGLDDGGQAIAAEKLITFARPTGRLAWPASGGPAWRAWSPASTAPAWWSRCTPPAPAMSASPGRRARSPWWRARCSRPPATSTRRSRSSRTP
jgi:hypothetical protein